MIEKFAGIFINGIILGGIYAFLATGFSLVYGTARIINLAHTAFYMVGTYIIFIGFHLYGLSLPLVIALSLVITPLISLCIYKLCLDAIREHESTVLLMTVAIAIVFQEVLFILFKGQYHGVPAFATGSLTVFGITIIYQHIIIIGLLVILIPMLWLFLSKTKLGLIIRAVSQDREAASLVGANVGQLILATIGIATFLAAVAGAVVAPMLIVEPQMWLHPLVLVLAAVVLGGLGSIKGSVIGAFILGFAETLVVFLAPGGSFIRTAVALAIMVLILLIRPEGLFGVVFEEERL